MDSIRLLPKGLAVSHSHWLSCSLLAPNGTKTFLYLSFDYFLIDFSSSFLLLLLWNVDG